MKKSLLLIAIVVAVFGCMAMTSCNDKPNDNDFPPRDESLAGSISYFGVINKAEGSYDGVALENLDYKQSGIWTDKVSDTEVSLNVISKWGETIVSLLIPIIPLSGVPYNVTFDHSCTDVTVNYNDAEYKNVAASIKGWIKDVNRFNMSTITRMSPPLPDYVSEIDIECIVNGKILILTLYD